MKPRSILFILLLLTAFPHPARAEAPTYICRIKAEYPHASTTSTQGLFIHRGSLYESSGGYGESFIAKGDIETGHIRRQYVLEGKFFAEGIAPLGDRLYALTWLSGTGFIHRLDSLERIEHFPYRPRNSKSEGWGLTHDGDYFIRSSGKAELHFHDSSDFTLVHTLPVHDKGTPVRLLNELEYANGVVLANIWKKDIIAIIDPESGAVKAWIDLAPLRQRIARTSGVANGIAFDRVNGRLYVTGKKWDKLFEITIEEELW